MARQWCQPELAASAHEAQSTFPGTVIRPSRSAAQGQLLQSRTVVISKA
jgi:hypothetical protein